MPEWTEEEILAAIIIGGLWLYVLSQWEEAYDDALDKWDEITTEYLDMMEALADCYCNITYPQQLKAIEAACSFEAPVPDCAEASHWRACSIEITRRYMDAEDCYREQYCLGPNVSRCDNGWTHVRESSAANATAAKWASDQRRNELMVQARTQFLGSAKAATWMDASPIGSLMNTATGKVNAIMGASAQGFNATASAGFFGISQLFGNFGAS